METLIYYFEKLYNTIKANGIYIFLSVFFVFLLFVISDVSDDFIYALSDKGNFGNVFFISLSFTLLTLALWVIPASFLKMFLGSKTPYEEVLFYYQNFEDIYNGKKNEKRNQIPVKYIAIAPWVIYTITLSVCLMKSLFIIESVWYVFLYLFLVSGYILNLLSRKYSTLYSFFTKTIHKRLLNSIVWIVLVIVVLPLIIFLMSSYFTYPELSTKCSIDPICVKKYYNTFLSILIIYNIFCILSTFLFLIHKENESTTTEGKYIFSKKLHRLTIFISISLLLIFCLLSLNSKLVLISPTVILVVVSTVFILAFELIYTTPKMIIIIDRYKTSTPTGKYDKQRYIFYLVLFLISIMFLIFPHKRIYMIKSGEGEGLYKDEWQFGKKALVDKRLTLEEQFDLWLIRNHHIDQKENNEPIDVILISGQGGGSTAGSWLLSGLLNVEATNPQFYNNIFSISTVSGSSNGANFYLAIKTKNILPEDVGISLTGNKIQNIVNEIYNVNYFSSNFLGLMFSDHFINPIVSLTGSNKYIDRNYILQREEINAMIAAGKSVGAKDETAIKSYFDQNYLDLWYKKDLMNKLEEENFKDQKPVNPLFFINTTLMDTGEKALFSPVKIDGLGIRAKDVVKEFANTGYGKDHYIPISAAVAQSQAFPMLSTYNLVPGTGYLGDGGFYENTGTSTTLAVYKKLKKHYKKCLSERYSNRKIRFILICFTSQDEAESSPDSTSNHKTKSKDNYNIFGKSMVYYTVSQTYKIPFKGHAKDALEALRQEKDTIDEFLEIKNSEKFATTRLISKKTINEMAVYANLKGNGASVIIEKLKRSEAERAKMISKDNNDAKVSTVYINYAGKAVKEELIKDLGIYIGNELKSTIFNKVKNKNETLIFTVPGLRRISSFEINQIRYFHKNDKDLAYNLQKELRNKGVNLEVKYFDYKNFSTAVPEGQLHIWIDNLGKYKKHKETVKR